MRTLALLGLQALLVPVAISGCNCHQKFSGLNGNLSASPPSLAFGNQAQGSKVTKTVTLTNTGTAGLQVSSVAIQGDSHNAFKAALTPTSLDVGATMTMTVSYTPPAQETDSATAVVESDGGPLSIPLTGTGIYACDGILCNGTNGVCSGTCQIQNGKGVCVFGGPCADPAQCLSSGSCAASPTNAQVGICTGTSDCVKPGQGTCNGNVLSGDIAPGTCDQGTGKCLYNQQTVTCDCACVAQNGTASCQYNWAPISGAPTGEYASVWASGQTAGDLWASVINRASAGATDNPQTIYHLSGGSWSQAAQIGNAQNPFCQGPGCGVLLTGSSDSDIYGAVDCTQVTSGNCTAGGAWHLTSAAADEPFTPATFQSGTVADLPLTPILDLGGTGFALNSDPTGPELMSNGRGSWTVTHNFHWYCQSLGSLWGSSATDLWIAWGCQSNGGGTSSNGSIWHWDGTSATASMPFATNDYAAAMWGSGGSDIWAVGSQRWHYNGSAWSLYTTTPMPSGPDYALWGNASDYYAGGGYPDLYHYTQSSQQWALECVYPGHNDPQVTSFSSDGTSVYAATSAGIMVRQ